MKCTLHLLCAMVTMVLLVSCTPVPPSDARWNATEPTLQSAADANQTQFAPDDFAR